MNIPNEILITLCASLPVSELRGSIPLGLYLKEPLAKVFLLSLIGNMLPVIPILYLLQPISERLRRFAFFKKFFDWLFERTKRKAALVERYEALGLALFVAIPLPITGAWTGCIAASLFKIRIRYAVTSIFTGIIIAAVIVTTLTLSGIAIFNKDVTYLLR